MTLADITAQFNKTAAKAPSLGKSIKFMFDQGPVHIDLTGDEAVVTNEDKEADCTIITSLETLDGIRKGDINAMSAVMTGKVKIKGDMGLAMKLPSLIA
ncbi:SCP2 sterol-binding domain-containing protein [Phaeodactylibacter luteus]|uniref:SCP2 sterol-binding domain-containing protein n=1 Tax=Phaeodactylibacter luteus TaxID=1564516 RepID=A0A5C6RHU8_9BACT|nr:SCP2 sterol-binding domain-containing protein [Phaeodactylibacter luteus]TXB61747.1 SCP2 sterol-binding domain-containing protein [Phaeodactylibacter luteus]